MLEIAVVLIVLHTVSGQPIEINPALITHMRGQIQVLKHAFTKDAECMINFADGKYITVRETCAEVGRLINREPRP